MEVTRHQQNTSAEFFYNFGWLIKKFGWYLD